jgi:acetylglutamate kinase
MADIIVSDEARQYARKFRGKTFLIKIGGEIIESDHVIDGIVQNIAQLDQFGIRMIIVHGGGKQANELSEKLGIKPNIVNGRRVTSASDLEVVKMVFAGKVNTELVAMLVKYGLKPVGISGIDGNTITAEKRPPLKMKNANTNQEETVDFGYVGRVIGANTDLVARLLRNGYTPVIAPLVCDHDGNILNINADSIAVEIAKKLRTDKFIVMTDVDGVLGNHNDPKSLISNLDTEKAKQLIDSGLVNGGMLPKLECCIDAVSSGVKRTHIINGFVENVLLKEVFTTKGIGTMIVNKKEHKHYKKKESRSNE